MSGDAASDLASIVCAFQRIPDAQDAPFQQSIEADNRIPNAWLGMFIPIEGRDSLRSRLLRLSLPAGLRARR